MTKIVILIVLDDENPEQIAKLRNLLTAFGHENTDIQDTPETSSQSGRILIVDDEVAIRIFSMRRFANHCNGIGHIGEREALSDKLKKAMHAQVGVIGFQDTDSHMLKLLAEELRNNFIASNYSDRRVEYAPFRKIQKFPIPAQCKGRSGRAIVRR